MASTPVFVQLSLLFEGNITLHMYKLSGATAEDELDQYARAFILKALNLDNAAHFQIFDAKGYNVIPEYFNATVHLLPPGDGISHQFTIKIVDNAGGNAPTNALMLLNTTFEGTKNSTGGVSNGKRVNNGCHYVITSCLVRDLDWHDVDGYMRPKKWGQQGAPKQDKCIKRLMGTKEFESFLRDVRLKNPNICSRKLARSKIVEQMKYRTGGAKKCQDKELTHFNYQQWQNHFRVLELQRHGRPQVSSPQQTVLELGDTPPTTEQPVTPPQDAVARSNGLSGNVALENERDTAVNRGGAVPELSEDPNADNVQDPSRVVATNVPRKVPGGNRGTDPPQSPAND